MNAYSPISTKGFLKATMFRYHILGVASPKGVRYLTKKWEKITSDIL